MASKVEFSTNGVKSVRPIPDLKPFRRTILAWDFWKDVREEMEELQEEVDKAKEERKGAKPLDEGEVQDLLEMNGFDQLTEAQQKLKMVEIERKAKQLNELPQEERLKMLAKRQEKAQDRKLKLNAQERVMIKSEAEGIVKVPLQFEDEAEYTKVFLPSFFREARSQIQRFKSSEMDSVGEVVEMQTFKVDGNFVKLELIRTPEEAQTKLYGLNDLMLLTQGDDVTNYHPVHTLALTEHSVGNILTVTTGLDMSNMSSKEGSRSKEVTKVIAARGSWRLAKVTSLATVIREYEGLMSMPHIFLRNVILNRDDSNRRADTGTEMQAAPAMKDLDTSAGSSTAEVAGDSGDSRLLGIPPGIQKFIESRYNESQQKAINDSRKISGITLVQGPPGTGKTTTVLGILAVLLNARATVAKAVSYSKYTQGGAEKKRPHWKKLAEQTQKDLEEKDNSGASSAEEEEEDKESESQIEERKRRRVELMRQRAPWLNGNFKAWTDEVVQEVPIPGSASCRHPYQKLAKDSLVSMSEIKQSEAPQKVMVCAPSNAAIDEVMRRIAKDGIVNEHGVAQEPPMLRLGPNAHKDLESYSLEKLVKKRLAVAGEMFDLNMQENEKMRLMKNARIVCTTLSISGHRDMVGFPEDFDTVIIDEASQGVEVSTLTPLKLGCRRLILVGDPKQLPATCFSEVAKNHDYDRSLFQRLQQSQHKVNMLSQQYRMHPAISYFPSQNFYDGKLLNVLETKEFEEKNPVSWWSIPCFSPVVFFHLKSQHEVSRQSFVNEDEANFVINFFVTMSALYPQEVWRNKLAVISPYAEQVGLIRRKFRALFNLAAKDVCPVDVNTVDGFQGREKDCVLVSCVRGAAEVGNAGIGFVKDKRRMNVAFTRARLNLWVVGHAEVLSGNPDWKVFIEQQKDQCRMLRVSKPYDNFLKRYLGSWYDRHPDLERPDPEILKVEPSEEVEEEGKEGNGLTFELTEEQLEELRAEEADRERQERDMEEASPSPYEDSEDEVVAGLAQKEQPAAAMDVEENARAPAKKNDDK